MASLLLKKFFCTLIATACIASQAALAERPGCLAHKEWVKGGKNAKQMQSEIEAAVRYEVNPVEFLQLLVVLANQDSTNESRVDLPPAVLMLKPTKASANGLPPHGWVHESVLPDLIELVNDNTRCASVSHVHSSHLKPGISSVGVEARRLLHVYAGLGLRVFGRGLAPDDELQKEIKAKFSKFLKLKFKQEKNKTSGIVSPVPPEK